MMEDDRSSPRSHLPVKSCRSGNSALKRRTALHCWRSEKAREAGASHPAIVGLQTFERLLATSVRLNVDR